MKADVNKIFNRLGIMQTKNFETEIILKDPKASTIIGTVADFLYDEDDTKVVIQVDAHTQTTLYFSQIKEVNRANR